MNLEQRIQFENLGFLHLPGFIPPELVRRLGSAFDVAAERCRGDWHQAIARGGADPRFCDIPDILDVDDAFIDVVDIPALVPLLLGAVGDDVQLNHTHARLFPPGKTFTAPWHSDMKHVLGIAHDHCPNFFVKVHYFFEDLEPDQGCLAFLPGTHRLPVGYPKPAISDPHNSSAVVKIVPKAGDCVMFNTHVLHMALDNKSEKIRKSLIYAYSHFWLKNYANGVPPGKRCVQHLCHGQRAAAVHGLQEQFIDGTPLSVSRRGDGALFRSAKRQRRDRCWRTAFLAPA
jgi:phytanoyl-CoA hydroxylase